MAYATARRSSPSTASREATVAPPEWSVPVSASTPFATALSAIIGLLAPETEATELLDAAGAALGGPEEDGPAAEAVGGDWASEIEETSTGSGVPAPPTPVAPAPTRRPSGVLGEVYDTHTRAVPRMRASLSRTQKTELDVFRRTWERSRGRYEDVAAKTGVPAILIAAIHYRESSMNFGTYLHQGDPLGRPARNHPRDIPIFHDWEEAAIHALNMKKGIRDSLGMTEDTTDPVAMATFAEAYNGLGYHYRDLTSPYVYAGTDQYRGGRFVADGKFDPASWDRRLGVLTIASEMGEIGPVQRAPGSETAGWTAVLAGDVALRQGSRGAAVETLQQRLTARGHAVSVDGQFGPGTRAAVVAFQRAAGMEADGVVGKQTAAALERGGATSTDPATEQAPERSPRDQAWSEVLGGGTILKVGSSGAAVEALQERLRALGYGVSIDGRFGPITRGCVFDLQRGMGLQVDGQVGPATAAAIDRRAGR
jgi:lysozyme family protein/peptidoglycan hydrolase-like protein with peptidoglycan-binding domain